MKRFTLSALALIVTVICLENCVATDDLEDRNYVGSESAEITENPKAELGSEVLENFEPERAEERLDNFSLASEDALNIMTAPNYKVYDQQVGWRSFKWWRLPADAGRTFFVTVTPGVGDPDLYAVVWNGTYWEIILSSVNWNDKIDKMTVRLDQSQDVYIGVYGYDNSSFDLSVSWELDNRLVLDVLHVSQHSLGDIAVSACSSASSAMLLAYHDKIRVNGTYQAAHEVFDTTANMQYGLLGRDLLATHLETEWGFREVYFDASGWSELYALIQSEIRQGRPMILGSRSMSSAGHYIVCTGFSGSDYRNATIIVNDPNGQWNSFDSWSTSISGELREYDYTTITSAQSDGVFVIHP